MLSVAVFSAGLKRVPVGFLFNKGRRLVDVYFTCRLLSDDSCISIE